MIPLLRFMLDLVLGFAAPRAVLIAENLLLRQQIIVLARRVARPRLRGFDRWLMSALAGRFRILLDAVIVVKPDTLIRWHRAGWRLLWRRRSRAPGRPPIDADLRALIRRMWRDASSCTSCRTADVDGDPYTQRANGRDAPPAEPPDLPRWPPVSAPHCLAARRPTQPRRPTCP